MAVTVPSLENYLVGEESNMDYTITGVGQPDRVYKGFQTPNWHNNDEIIALAVFDGDNDLYAVDSTANLNSVADEIDHYYHDDYDRGPESLQFYRRIERGT